MGEKILTGIEGFDLMTNGGFPKGSLILVAGNPGTGKTVFSANFIYNGIKKYGERGVYISFVEGKETFYRNMRGFGFNFEELEKDGRFLFIEMLTMKERGISTVLDWTIDKIQSFKAQRLVIDSFSAMAQAFKEQIDVRVITHLILSRIVRQIGCTTIIISEIPIGEQKIGLGVEEFIADGVIIFKMDEIDERLIRDLEIMKLRGTELHEKKAIFTLKDGFKVFPSFKAESIEKPKRFQPIPDPPGRFSTGIPEFDRLLDGGFPRGALVLLEVDEHVTTFQYHLIVSPIGWNFLAKGNAVIVIPSSGVDYNIVKERVLGAGFTEDEINNLLRVCVQEGLETPDLPYIAKFKGKDLEKNHLQYIDMVKDLMSKSGKPVLSIIGADTMLSRYGIEEVIEIANIDATRLRQGGCLGITILKPGYDRLAKILGAIADVHFKMTREHGALLLYGLKPRTEIYAVEMDVTKGYVMPKLTPII